ncbi:MAG: tRNA pseudouridine(55) synthase TruB [Pseudomonadales bacterium]|nr:tRNA pseudouridine(55) synthase TruB [Pseudomonadales bacterium]
MARRRRGRPVNGMLIVDKPQGISSNDVVQKAKRLFGAQKVGHTGSLDPLATGVLPLCFGEATKFSQFLLSSDKKYWVRIKLGVATDTGDADGEVIARSEASHVTAVDVEGTLNSFRGDIEQIPSMFSALKHNGQPLYKLARQGIEVPREARCVHIFSNELVGFDDCQFELNIHCSKGTYVRTIAEEIGKALNVGAHVTALRRVSAGPFDEDDLVSLDRLETERENGSLDKFLMPTASAVGQWPKVRLTDATSFYLKQGQPVLVPHAPSGGWVRLCELNGQEESFLGVGEVLDDGRIAPRRLVVG